MKRKKIYLAIPYSGIEELSFRLANIIAYKLTSLGHLVVSPISMAHPIVEEGKHNSNLDENKILGTFEYWEDLDYSLIDWSDEVWYVSINNELLENSTGTQGEIRYAIKNNKVTKPIYIQYMNVTNDGIEIKGDFSTEEFLKFDFNDLQIILPE